MSSSRPGFIDLMIPTPNACLEQILEASEKTGWKGWDPYDALSSPLVRSLCLGNRWLQTAWIQFFKRSPINLRGVFLIPKLKNPKALALLASACLEKTTEMESRRETAQKLLAELRRMAIRQGAQIAWGYPFDWRSRAFFAPRNTPNVIVTSFCGHAFLDSFETSGRSSDLSEALGACQFILKSLHVTQSGKGRCFSYTPLDQSCIHNANLLAASLLLRAARLSGKSTGIEAAEEAAAFTLGAQRSDGSWFYGEAPNQHWVDGFHTGFNLLALEGMIRYDRRRTEWLSGLKKGFVFYKERLFLSDGTPRYYADNTWPLDIHSAAVAILTFCKLSGEFREAKSQAKRVLSWTLGHMWDSQRGGFLYRKGRFLSVSIPYLRWANAWMSRALAATLTLESEKDIYASHAPAQLPH